MKEHAQEQQRQGLCSGSSTRSVDGNQEAIVAYPFLEDDG